MIRSQSKFAVCFPLGGVLSCLIVLPMFGQESTESAAATKTSKSETVDKAIIEKLERYLSGSRWTGNFTVTGMEKQELTAETYEITRAKKLPDGDQWLLTARIKYGDKDNTVTLPPIDIKWAGESPVITVDKLSIPGMGTFDARVVIRNNKYAGTWMHDSVGGHLFGTIEKMESKPGSQSK